MSYYMSKYVFISYSHSDRVFVNKLIRDLWNTGGLPVWLDTKRLKPGSPDWQEEIRKAVQGCFAFLLIASPESRRSKIVQAEYALAKQYERAIYPVWAKADNWIDCIPLDAFNYQYIDCRKRLYKKGLSEIIKSLRSLVHSYFPIHFSSDNFEFDMTQPFFPPGYIQINKTGHSRWEENEEYVYIDPRAYETLQEMLDELYVNYLYKELAPYTYGKDWVLCSLLKENMVFLPLLCLYPNWSTQPEFAPILANFFRTKPDRIFSTDYNLEIIYLNKSNHPVIGLACYNEKTYGVACRNSFKGLSLLVQRGILEIIDISAIDNLSEYQYSTLMVINGGLAGFEEEATYAGKVFRETSKTLHTDNKLILDHMDSMYGPTQSLPKFP